MTIRSLYLAKDLNLPLDVVTQTIAILAKRRAGRRLWEPADDAALRRLYPDLPTTVVAQQLGRSVVAIHGRAGVLGLNKSEAYLAGPHACRLRRGDNVGKATRFPKGHVPANKGLRRPGWHRGRMQETQFQKGTRSGKAASHHMPIGSTRLIEGYIYRKVSDVPNVAYTVNWKPEHHLVWARAHGPIPPGHALIFRDGNRQNTQIENLRLVTRRELMARNTVHNLPPALAKTVQLLGRLNRQIAKRTRHAPHD